MLWGGDDDEFFVPERLQGKACRGRDFQEAHNVESFGQDLSEERTWAVDVDLDVDARELPTKARQSRHDAIDDEVRDANRERAREAALEDGDVLLHGAEPVQRLFSVAPQSLAGRGQPKPSTGTLEEGHAEELPERAELEADRRLGGVQLARDLGEVAA